MYFKDIESNKERAQEHTANLKRQAAERLRNNASNKKRFK
jgi:hypothetical protein